MQRLYRELYHKLKDKIHTTPDTPEIRQVKKTQEAVSEVSNMSEGGEAAGCRDETTWALTVFLVLAVLSSS